jgi:hypothetical protein
MMTRKTLGILAVALVVLGGLSYFTSRQRYGAAQGGGFESLLPSGVDAGAVQSIKAWVGAIPDTTVELTRSGDGWVVASRWNWKAKSDLVDRLVEDLKGLSGELRSSSADVLPDYQIDDDNGLHLVGTGAGGTEMFHLIVGKSATRGGTFVRKNGSNDVYLSTAALRSSFGLWGDEQKPPDPKRWIELRVNQTDRTNVDRIVLHDGSSVLTLDKEFPTAGAPDSSGVTKPDRANWTWKPDAAGPIDKAKADGILGTACNLYATDVVDPAGAADYGLADPTRWMELFLSDGSTVKVRFGTVLPDEKKIYLAVGDDGLPAKTYESTVNRIFLKRSELKPQTS